MFKNFFKNDYERLMFFLAVITFSYFFFLPCYFLPHFEWKGVNIIDKMHTMNMTFKIQNIQIVQNDFRKNSAWMKIKILK